MKFKLITTNLGILCAYLLYLRTLNNFNIKKIIYLPIQTKKVVLLKSPHVHKKAQEHFIFKKYSVLIISDDKNKTKENLKSILQNIPSMLVIKFFI